MKKHMPDYDEFDKNPELLALIFYPRRGMDPCPLYASDALIPVADDILISCRFYSGDPQNPWILYFHGNGEIVSDYDQIAPFYLQKKLNLVVADYRGYGASSGTPSLRNLQEDCHPIFFAVRRELSQRGYAGKLWLMGRSLGSLSALELAASHPGEINGLILESGFTSIIPILQHLFLPLIPDERHLVQTAKEALELTGRIFLPALVIHGDQDALVPLQEARTLYGGLGSPHKRLLIIPNADHNSIIFARPSLYFGAISEFIEETDPDQTVS
jgi:uncharacterized protein